MQHVTQDPNLSHTQNRQRNATDRNHTILSLFPDGRVCNGHIRYQRVKHPHNHPKLWYLFYIAYILSITRSI